MYKRHKIQVFLCVLIVSLMSFILNWDFSDVAEISVTVASIAMGVYIAAASALLGSQYARELKGKTDQEDKTKTLLGVLAGYFRYAGVFCILLILISIAFLIPADGSISVFLLKCASSVSYGIFAANILFLWLILIFVVNSMGNSV